LVLLCAKPGPKPWGRTWADARALALRASRLRRAEKERIKEGEALDKAEKDAKKKAKCVLLAAAAARQRGSAAARQGTYTLLA
jgi:hypothetical protein